MLTLTHRYRIYPDAAQEQQFIEWMEICRGAFNYALREIKDWCNSRKCLVDRCSLEREYILSAEMKFPCQKLRKNFPDWVRFLLKFFSKLLSNCIEVGSIFRAEDLVFHAARNTDNLSRCFFLNSRKIR